MNRLSLFLLLFIMIYGCRPQSSGNLLEIKLTTRIPQGELKMSDLVDSIQIIRLETNDSVLLPSHFDTHSSSQYILTIDEKEIHQFTAKGQYIRRIATKGRGPEEFKSVSESYADLKQERLYLCEWERFILVYNLQNGQFIDRVPTEFAISQLLDIKNDTIICSPHVPPGDTAHQIHYLTTQGKTIGFSFPRIGVALAFHNAYSTRNGEVKFKPQDSDTVFSIQNFKSKISYVIKNNLPHDPGWVTQVSPSYENSQFYIFNCIPIHSTISQTGDVINVSHKDPFLCFVDKEKLEIRSVTELYIDKLDAKVPFTHLAADNNRLVIPLSALEFKDLLEKKRTKQGLTSDLESLYQSIEENDNPLLIIGTFKK